MTTLVGAAAFAPVSAHAAAVRADDLHRRYRKAVFEYCVRQLHSREEGEDAAQTVFLNAYRSIAKGNEPQSERAWLFAIAEHVVSHRRRANSRRLQFEVPVDADDLAYLAVAPSLEDVPDLTGLVEALSEMPDLQRRVLLLREWRGLSYQEVADELGVSETVVQTLLARGRNRLADRMGDQRRRGKRGLLGLCFPWPSLQSLFGSGAAVKGLAGLASIALVTGAALPLRGLVTHAPVHPGATRAHAALPRPSRVSRPHSHGVAPARVGVRSTHTGAASGGAPASPHLPTIPVETASSDVPVETDSAPAPDVVVYQSLPVGDTQVAESGGDAGQPALQTADAPAGPPGQAKRDLTGDPGASAAAQGNGAADSAPKAGTHPALRLKDGP